jgi:hypothetical protein
MTIVNLKSRVSGSTQYSSYETTRNPEDGMSPESRWWSKAFSYDDQSASVVSIGIPLNSRVLRVALEIGAGFTDTTAVVVGDGDTANGWIETGVITPTTAGDFGLDYNSTFGVKGKLYQSGDTIDITFTGVASAGEGILFVEMISYNEAIAIEDVS